LIFGHNSSQSMLSLTLLSTLLLSASAVMPIMQPSDSSCKDFEGSFLASGFDLFTCKSIRDYADENGCIYKLGEIMKQFPGSYIPDERISLDMTLSDICPVLYKDLCRTCATDCSSAVEIHGSQEWWLCGPNMIECGSKCCCKPGFAYERNSEQCLPCSGSDKSFCSINGFWNPEGYNYVREVTEGVNSEFPSFGPGTGTMKLDGTVHWIWHNNNREHRGTFSDDCSTVTWENNARWFRTPPAFWETCRWREASPEEKLDGVTLTGLACNVDEILVGLELSIHGMVDKIKCCSVGGHSSVTGECSYEHASSRQATCDDNNHMVFNGIFDKRDPHAHGDDFGEVLLGKCCEIECHETWCGDDDRWGVNRNQCMDIDFKPETGSQDLHCPSGYLMTAIHEGNSNDMHKRQHGVQNINKISCCALHTIGAPTQAPSVSPSPSPTTAPSPAPTTAPTQAPSVSPSLSPSTSPTTAPSSHPTTSPTTAPTSVWECLLALRDVNLSDKYFLEGIEDCVPCFDTQRRNLEGRLLNENGKY